MESPDRLRRQPFLSPPLAPLSLHACAFPCLVALPPAVINRFKALDDLDIGIDIC